MDTVSNSNMHDISLHNEQKSVYKSPESLHHPLLIYNTQKHKRKKEGKQQQQQQQLRTQTKMFYL